MKSLEHPKEWDLYNVKVELKNKNNSEFNLIGAEIKVAVYRNEHLWRGDLEVMLSDNYDFEAVISEVSMIGNLSQEDIDDIRVFYATPYREILEQEFKDKADKVEQMREQRINDELLERVKNQEVFNGEMVTDAEIDDGGRWIEQPRPDYDKVTVEHYERQASLNNALAIGQQMAQVESDADFR